MADNVTLNTGSGGATLAADDIAGTHHQRVKVQQGADGSATDVSHTNPLPVEGGEAENAAAAANPVQIGGRYDATPRTLGDGDVGALALDADGAAHVSDGGNSLTVDAPTGTPVNVQIGDGTDQAAVSGAGALQVDVASALPAGTNAIGKLAANSGVDIGDVDVLSVVPGTGATNLGKAEDAVHGSADVGVMALAVRRAADTPTSGADGDYEPLKTDANGHLKVEVFDGGDSHTVDGTVSVDLNAGTNTNEVVGDVAHDAAAAGNPVLIAARATNSVEGLTQVANADASFVASDLNGVIITRPHTTLEEIITERVSDTGGSSTAFTNFAAGGAGIHNYVTTITIYNSSATDGYVDFRDGTGGSVIFTAPAPATSGSVINLPVPLKGAANTALAYDVSGALSTVYISVVGFQAQG